MGVDRLEGRAAVQWLSRTTTLSCLKFLSFQERSMRFPAQQYHVRPYLLITEFSSSIQACNWSKILSCVTCSMKHSGGCFRRAAALPTSSLTVITKSRNRKTRDSAASVGAWSIWIIEEVRSSIGSKDYKSRSQPFLSDRRILDQSQIASSVS